MRKSVYCATLRGLRGAVPSDRSTPIETGTNSCTKNLISKLNAPFYPIINPQGVRYIK